MSGSRWFDKSLVLRDGVRLISRIWLPNSNGPWPALLMRQPYGREIASTITYSHPEWWASKGYMVIIQDVRVDFCHYPHSTMSLHLLLVMIYIKMVRD